MVRFLKAVGLAGIPFGLVFALAGGVIVGVFKGAEGGLKIGILIFLFAGLAFGLSMAGFQEAMRRSVGLNRPLAGDGPILRESLATRLLNKEGVGGWLYLTGGALWFKSHGVNIARFGPNRANDQVHR